MAKTIVLHSGGLDSTYVLHYLLTNTSDEITALFVDESYVTVAGRCFQTELSAYQKQKSKKTVDWLSANVREVTFASKPMRNLESGVTPPVALFKIAAQYANDNGFVKICSGNGPRVVDVPWGIPTGDEYTRLDSRRVYAEVVNEIAGSGVTCSWPILDNNANIAMRIAAVPSALANLCAVCISPTINDSGEYTSCGKCHKEAFRAMAVDAVSRNLTTAENFATWFASDIDDDPEITFNWNGDFTITKQQLVKLHNFGHAVDPDGTRPEGVYSQYRMMK